MSWRRSRTALHAAPVQQPVPRAGDGRRAKTMCLVIPGRRSSGEPGIQGSVGFAPGFRVRARARPGM